MRVYAIDMTTRFRGLTRREGMVLRGAAGWGEFSPFWDYEPAQCRPWLAAAREAAEAGWPAPVRDSVAVNVTIPACAAKLAAQLAVRGGCETAKVKVAEPGQSLSEECDRLAAVRDALGPEAMIRIDANGAWDLQTATDRLPRLDRAAGGLQYAEQPCASVADLARLRRAQHVPIAADESIRLASDPMAVARAGAADFFVLKVQPLGGVRACLELAAQLPGQVVVSSALETSVGIAAGVALAAALPDEPPACGLGTVQLLQRDIVADPLVPVAGRIAVRRPEPVPELLDTVADEATTARWEQRLASVEAVR